MKKYSEHDIEKMLFNTEKTEPSFDKTVNFPICNIVYKRRRFTSLLIAACLVVFIVSGSLIVAFVQGGSDYPNPSEGVCGSETDPTNSNIKDNSFSNDWSDISDFVSFPYDNSGYISGTEQSGGDETRNPFGEFDSSDIESGTTSDSSVDGPLLPLINYPQDRDFFAKNGMGSLTADEYFKSNPNKELDNVPRLSYYSRSMLTIGEIKQLIGMLGNSFGLRLDFDEELYQKNGEFVGTDTVSGLVVNVSKYGDWYLTSDDELLYIGARTEALYNEIQNRVSVFINKHQDVFNGGKYKITHKFTNTSLVVYLSEITDDKVMYEMNRFVLTFDKVGTNDFYLKTIESKVANMNRSGEYPSISYKEALREFFKQPITEDDDPNASESEMLDCLLVGYDVRYLYSSEYEGMYPYYAFVIKFDPYGENPRYKAFFVPAIKKEFINVSE